VFQGFSESVIAACCSGSLHDAVVQEMSDKTEAKYNRTGDPILFGMGSATQSGVAPLEACRYLAGAEID
jgi:hypothetical protein